MVETSQIKAVEWVIGELAKLVSFGIRYGEGLERNAPSTIARKGFDRPLRETDELMKSIRGIVVVEGDVVRATIDADGEENQKKLWINEFGVPGRIPPRPVVANVFDTYGDDLLDLGLNIVMDDLERLWIEGR